MAACLADEHSCPCTKSELDLAFVPPTQVCIESTKYEKCFPVTSTTANAPLEFEIYAGDHYLDLSQSYLYLKCRILLDGAVPEINTPPSDDKDMVIPVNYLVGSLFKNMELTLNNHKISQTSNLYAYRCMFETLLNYGDDIEKTWMQMGMYHPDGREFDYCDKGIEADQFRNYGAHARWTKSKGGKPFELLGKVHHEIFAQPKLLINGSELRLKFERNNKKFFLIQKVADEKFDLIIDQAIFYICKKKVTNSIQEEHQKYLLTKNIKYPMRRVQLRHWVRSGGRSDISEPNFYNGILPRRVIVAFVSSDRFNDNVLKNPFFFHHHNISDISLKVGGTPIPYTNIETDFANDNYYQAYAAFLKGCNHLFDDKSNAITPQKYKNGHTLFVWNLAADGEDTTMDLLKEGKLSLEVKTDTQFTEPITLVAYFEFDAVLEIDSFKKVKYLEEN